MASGVSFHGTWICGPEVRWKITMVEAYDPGGCYLMGPDSRRRKREKGLGSRKAFRGAPTVPVSSHQTPPFTTWSARVHGRSFLVEANALIHPHLSSVISRETRPSTQACVGHRGSCFSVASVSQVSALFSPQAISPPSPLPGLINVAQNIIFSQRILSATLGVLLLSIDFCSGLHRFFPLTNLEFCLFLLV